MRLSWGERNSRLVSETAQKTTQETAQKTTQKQQEILDYLKAHPHAGRRELAEALVDITEDGVKYNLKKLQNGGRLRRVGSTKGGYWEVIGVVE